MTTLCLTMIVKNEAHVIARCLASVKPLLSYWVVVDTGSTDGTQDLVRQALEGVPGELHERPWVDFAHNRTEALALAREKSGADYLLVIDADDVLVVPPGVVLPPLTHDAYALRVEYDGTTYYRTQLLKTSLPWRYEGVVHESPVCDAKFEPATLEGIVYRIVGGGARSRDPERYRKDADLLERELAKDPTNTRNAFYLGQSYRDAGDHERAIAAYERRATLGGWAEEVYYSLLQAAALREMRGEARDVVWSAYLRAHQSRPERAEALTALARYCRLGGELALAYVFADAAAAITRPRDLLFVDESVYAWRALDELAIAAFYTGHFDRSAAASARLLTEGRLPAGEIERVRKNFAFVADARAPGR